LVGKQTPKILAAYRTLESPVTRAFQGVTGSLNKRIAFAEKADGQARPERIEICLCHAAGASSNGLRRGVTLYPRG
jgi:hypothetical protein